MKIITNDNYVDKAEAAIKKTLSFKKKNGYPVGLPTTTQIRNILSMTANIYNDVMMLQEETMTEKMLSQIQYLRIRIVYEVGRDDKDGPVQNFVKSAELLDILKEIGNKKENYILFSHYMEALVAFHKFNNGRD